MCVIRHLPLHLLNFVYVGTDILMDNRVSVCVNCPVKVKAVLEMKVGSTFCASLDFLIDTVELGVSWVNSFQVVLDVAFLAGFDSKLTSDS